MKNINEAFQKQNRPIKLLQFGEGNFLRAFVDYMVDIANEKGVFDGNVEIIKPISFGNLEAFNSQDCIYTVLLRGKQNGETVSQKRLITSVETVLDAATQYDQYSQLATLPHLRFIVSNTTEAGIVYDDSDALSLNPPKSYPGKLTKLLYERFLAFDGTKDKGLIILPVELIEKNGTKLLECCLKLAKQWGLSQAFCDWLCDCNIFCNTLVDRIVTGYPKDEITAVESELGYEDKLIVASEPFALWVIESEKIDIVRAEFPLDEAGLPVIFTQDLQPYRERKVRILNGAHTATVLAAYLAGLDTVGELMNDKIMRAFIEKVVYDDLAPYVPLPTNEVKEFADSVMERFENPFIKHNLLSISLNSVSKFKVRVLPSIKDAYAKTSTVPDALCLSLAALMSFYSGEKSDQGCLVAKRGNDMYEIMDDNAVLDFFAANHKSDAEAFTHALLKRADFWGENLSGIDGLAEKVANHLQNIRENGAAAAVSALLG